MATTLSHNEVLYILLYSHTEHPESDQSNCKLNIERNIYIYIYIYIYIVCVIESAAYGVIFMSCLCQSLNERGTRE